MGIPPSFGGISKLRGKVPHLDFSTQRLFHSPFARRRFIFETEVKMLAKLRPAGLGGPILVNESGLPRYWPTVWLSLRPADHSDSTIIKLLGHIDSFYRYAEATIGAGAIEDAIAYCNLECLLDVLEGYFLSLRDRRPLTGASEECWQAAVRFVLESTKRAARASNASEQLHAIEARLNDFRLSTGHLYVGRRRNPERIRSLPADVVEVLYEMLDPTSQRNPFKGISSRWRAYIVFILLLHQGLRRGELLILPTDAVKRRVDRATQCARRWLSVKFNEYEDDPRYSTPSIKNAPSVRQIPVSETTAAIVDQYVANYRGTPNHSFLITSQKRLPLSTERITQMFGQISAALPRTLRTAIRDQTGEESVTPHDLRHTCAVFRLNQLLGAGVEMSDALERLRAFFGWSRDSEMPQRYARAVFEHRLASVWNCKFDDRVEVLRSIPATMK